MPMKIEIISTCVAAGSPRNVGDIVEVTECEARLLKSYGFVKDALADVPDAAAEDVLVMTYDGLKGLARKDQLALAKDMGLDLPKKATEDEIITAILDAFEQQPTE